MKKLILGSFFAAVLGASALPAAAHVMVRVGPAPLPVYEVVPAPRAGWVWVPGAWVVRHRHYHWVPGHWARPRPVVYAPARWYYR